MTQHKVIFINKYGVQQELWFFLKKTKRIEKQFKPTDEIDKGEPTGNKLLPRECGFCGFRHNCWSKAQFLPKHTSRAKNPPYVWYTKVAKNAHT